VHFRSHVIQEVVVEVDFWGGCRVEAVMDTYYARWEHGNHKVIRNTKGYQVHWPCEMGGTVSYPSARQTILALVNGSPVVAKGARDPKMTFDRYFKIGRHASRRSRRNSQTQDALLMFSAEISVAQTQSQYDVGDHLSVAVNVRPPGIDLEAREHEVRKLFYAGFGRKVIRMGYDPEEVLQEVYKGLLVRNNGKCPFDPEKSSFGHYVHMVCAGRVANYHRKHSRRSRYEVFGVSAVGEPGTIIDVAEADLASTEATQYDTLAMNAATEDLTSFIYRRGVEERHNDPDFLVTCAVKLLNGQRRGEIATETGKTTGQIGRVLRTVRAFTLEWHQAQQ
jgi:DNA-directed RNA polymerase specialized sigma24 family protein